MAYLPAHTVEKTKMFWVFSLFTYEEITLFAKGKLFCGYENSGVYFINLENTNGFNFSV